MAGVPPRRNLTRGQRSNSGKMAPTAHSLPPVFPEMSSLQNSLPVITSAQNTEQTWFSPGLPLQNRCASADGSGNQTKQFIPRQHTSGSCEWSRQSESSLSWTDDEVEWESTQRVQALLDICDAALFGELDLDEPVEVQLLEECRNWRNHFPHFRITGVTLKEESPTEDEDSPFLGSEACCTSLGNGVGITGHRLSPSFTVVGAQSRFGFSDDSRSNPGEEEVFSSHGHFDEFEDCALFPGGYRDPTRNSVFPPWKRKTYCGNKVSEEVSSVSQQSISPSELGKKIVMNHLCSMLWTQVIKWINPLIEAYSSHVLQETAQLSSVSRVPSGNEQFRTRLQSVSSPKKLNGLLHISPKTRLNRHGFSGERPPSAQIPRPLSSRINDHLLAPLPTNQIVAPTSLSARRLGPNPTRLEPLDKTLKRQDDERTGAVNLPKVSRTPSPGSPPYWSRHLSLPPIDVKEISNQRSTSAVNRPRRSLPLDLKLEIPQKNKIILSPVQARSASPGVESIDMSIFGSSLLPHQTTRPGRGRRASFGGVIGTDPMSPGQGSHWGPANGKLGGKPTRKSKGFGPLGR